MQIAQTTRTRLNPGSRFHAQFDFSVGTMRLLSSANCTNDGEEEMVFEANSNTIDHQAVRFTTLMLGGINQKAGSTGDKWTDLSQVKLEKQPI